MKFFTKLAKIIESIKPTNVSIILAFQDGTKEILVVVVK